MVNAELRVHKRRVHGKKAKHANFGVKMVVRGTKGMRCGQQYILGWGSMLKISYMGPLSRSCLAKTLTCSTRTLTRVLELVACVFQEWQRCQLRLLSHIVASQRIELDFVICSVSWDETQQRISMPLVANSKAVQRSSSWETMVVRFTICFGWQGKVFVYNFVCPPLPSLTGASRHIYAAIVKHPLTYTIREFCLSLMAPSKINLFLHLSDGHPANEKFHYHRYGQEVASGNGRHMPKVPCCNHRNNLIIIAVLTGVVLQLVSDMYIAVVFMRMGGHFLRLAAVTCSVIDDKLDWVRSPSALQLQASAAYWHELIDYLADNYDDGSQMMTKYMRAEAKAKYKQRLQGHMGPGKALNGAPRGDGRVQHLCRGCCKTRREVVDKMTVAVQTVVLSSIPPTPEVSKWTKLCPCLDLSMVSGISQLMHLLLTASGRTFHSVLDGSVAASSNPAGPPRDAGDGDANIEEVNLHKLAGSRYKRCIRLAEDFDKQIHMLAVALEPLRYLHLYFMRLGHAQPDYNKVPGLLNLIWGPTSVVYLCLQYYSSLLGGRSSRLVLIWPRCGSASYRDWLRSFPVFATTFRRLIISAAAWLERRLWLMCSSDELKFFGLADRRRADEHA